MMHIYKKLLKQLQTPSCSKQILTAYKYGRNGGIWSFTLKSVKHYNNKQKKTLQAFFLIHNKKLESVENAKYLGVTLNKT